MRRVLFGFKRCMVSVPWRLFMLILRREAGKTARILGGLDEDQRKVHHFVVKNLPSLAGPMPPDVIAANLKMDESKVVRILDELERRLIFLYRPGGRDVVWAYPVTAEPTPHNLAFSTGERVWAA